MYDQPNKWKPMSNIWIHEFKELQLDHQEAFHDHQHPGGGFYFFKSRLYPP